MKNDREVIEKARVDEVQKDAAESEVEIQKRDGVAIAFEPPPAVEIKTA